MDKIRLNQFLDFKYISQLKTNDSNTLAAFLSSKANLKDNQYTYDLFITDGVMKKRVMKVKDTSSFIFESDDTILMPFFRYKKEEKLKSEKKSLFYRYDIKKDKLEKAYTFSAPFQIVKDLGNKLLLTGFFDSKMHQLYQVDDKSRKELLKDMKKENSYEDITDLPFYFNGQGFTSNKRQQVFIYDKNTKAIMPLFKPDFNADVIKVSQDKKTVYVVGSPFNNTKALCQNIYKYNVGSGILETIYNQKLYSISNLFIVDDILLVQATNMQQYGLNENEHFYKLENHDLVLFKDMFNAIDNSVGSDVRLGSNNISVIKDGLYFLTTTNTYITLNHLDKNGEYKNVYEMPGSIDGIVYVNGIWLIVGLYKQKLQELYKLDLIAKKVKPFTSFNRRVLANRYIAKPKPISYKQSTHTVDGFVLLPQNFDRNKRYKAILDIHGGPKTVYGSVYYHEMQVWANMGYIVFFANPRGSDGKGNQFADIRGKYGTIDYEDLMGFTDLVCKKYPQIDYNQMYVTGGSYGGYMTNWIVSQTKRFKAAATQRSISNWLSFYGTSDIGFYFAKDQTGGHPLLDTEKLWRQSPLKYAMNIETPLLLIHSDEDYRCPIEQAMQLYSVLKEKGIDTKLVWFKGETHELSRSGKPQARLKRLTEITYWFEAH